MSDWNTGPSPIGRRHPATLTPEQALANARAEDAKQKAKRRSGFRAPRHNDPAALPAFLDNPRSPEGRSMLPMKPPGGRP